MSVDGRHILNEEERVIISLAKENLTTAIYELKNRGIRKANIELELVIHIKNLLKEE